jgi:hypothetical protein
MWDIDIEDAKGLLQFEPHRCAVNCISASHYDMFKIYTTSHDGTLLCADIEKGVFNNVCTFFFIFLISSKNLKFIRICELFAVVCF